MGCLDIPQKRLVTPQEAVKISYTHGCVSTLEEVKAISDEWGNRYSDPTYDHYCMLAAVYTAGYIQAKREERARASTRKIRRKADYLEQIRDRVKMWVDLADNENALERMAHLTFSVWKRWGRTKKKRRQRQV